MSEPTTAEREAEQKLCAAMLRSRYWKWQLTYLAARRDALIAVTPRNMMDAAMAMGALQEVARLMNGPAVVAKYLAAKEGDEEETEETPDYSPHAAADVID